ncbi:MAG TPA: D-alanyl-D-alanine carboxypeptidase family protein [Symbiobacteriaceae bacterium]|nr:D-alanyl-D-alanine carboxypeptidase family protein [Symbiobacteriaceae bacterium]
MRKRTRVFAYTLSLLMFGICWTAPASADPVQPPTMHGKSAVLLDGSTGQLLYQYNPAVRNYPASTTKLLTALVAMEHGQLNQPITVSEQAVNKPWDSASCYISAHETQPLEYLMYGMLLPSGNDCADAIGEGVAKGDVNQFVAWMNETAVAAGATNSHFTNANGLHDPNHYTTALDLALIARAAFNNPHVRKIAGTKAFDWPGKETNGTYYNLDSLLWNYEGTVGGKTGFTEEAGHTLVNAAERNGLRLIAVGMGYQDKASEYQDVTALLDWGFDQFARGELLSPGKVLTEVPVVDGTAATVPAVVPQPFAAAVAKVNGQAPNLRQTFKPNSNLAAPVQPGEQVGTVEVWEGNRLLQSLPLVAQTGVASTPVALIKRGAGVLSIFLTWLSYIGSALLISIVLLRMIAVVRRRRRLAAQRIALRLQQRSLRQGSTYK